MTCAKQTVTCTLVFDDGREVTGSNWCANPQASCPRLPGEGYEKCRTICGQSSHAEVDAIEKATAIGLDTRGTIARLRGHSYACQSCQEALQRAGVLALMWQ